MLQKGLETLQTKEDSSVTQIEALDKKIGKCRNGVGHSDGAFSVAGLIGEKSVEFEEVCLCSMRRAHFD